MLGHGRTEGRVDVVSIHGVLFALNKDQPKYPKYNQHTISFHATFFVFE
jgi:hypothetical protein